MTTDYKVTELFCIIDEFCKHFEENFKHYYLFFIKGTMKSYFPKAVSYNPLRGVGKSSVLPTHVLT